MRRHVTPNSGLRTWRKRLKISQLELAEYLGVDRTTISRWESGKQAIEHRQMLALALKHYACQHLEPTL